MQIRVDDVISAVRRYRINFTNEKELQQGVAGVFDANKYEYEREAVLASSDRIDFLIGGIGVEVKVGGSLSALLRQLYRYAGYERIECLLVISSRKLLTRLPAEIRGKPIRAVDVGNVF